MSNLSTTLARAVNTIRISTRMGEGMRMMKTREFEFANSEECELSGVAMIPEAREYIDKKLDEMWGAAENNSRYLTSFLYPEVVIGSGVHAAVYCAVRCARGFPPPVVLEASDRVGGTFAMSRKPSFFLNSSNRPGRLVGLPLENGALNVLPGAPIQPSMLSFSDYQTNTDVGWIVRLMLAKYGNVFPATQVKEVEVLGTRNTAGAYHRLTLDNGRTILAQRLIDARGIGSPRLDTVTAYGETDRLTADGRFVRTFNQFMTSLDNAFPLRGLNRVAVIGSGDASKCAVEALLGIGPGAAMQSVGLDYVNRIDWYESGNLPSQCSQWRRQIRGRYQRIGSFLPDGSNARSRDRVRVMGRRGYLTPSFESVIVNGLSYDTAIVCTGFQRPSMGAAIDFFEYMPDGYTQVATRASGRPYYRVGPAADIDFSGAEYDNGVANNPQNRVAIFRLANRTATLAASLPNGTNVEAL